MSKVRVYEVAKQLNMDQKSLVTLFQSMGFGEVRNHMSSVESDVVERVKRHLERQKSPEVKEERMRADGRVVKRRARAADPTESAAVSTSAPPSIPSAEPSAPRAAPPPPPSSHAGGRAGDRMVPAAAASSPSTRRADPEPSAPAMPPPPASSRRQERGLPAEPRATGDAPAARGSSERATEVARSLPAPEVEIPAAPPSNADRRPAARSSQVAATGRAAEAGPARASETTASPRGDSQRRQQPVDAPDLSWDAPAETRAPAAAAAPPATNDVSARVEAPPASPPPPPPVETRSPEPPAPARAEEPAPARRPSAPPRTGIDVWQGRPGVPMPAAPRPSAPPARRTTYDPRAGSAPARPGAGFGPGGRPMMGGRGRPGFRPRPGMNMPRRPAMVSTQEMSSHKKVIKIEEQVSLQQLAARMSLKSTDVLMRLLSMGMTGVNINTTLDADTAKLLASEFGWSVEDVAVSEEANLAAATGNEAEVDVDFELRPPIVTVMGHVDHGKTSLLDRIRKASVAEGEAGGITQHIGAYRVETAKGTIAFLDTPGHEAFTAMRARGASLTDIVILVVAADDGVMPQTREAIAHAQSAKVPIIVAVNKIDKPGADPEKIKRDLASLGLQPEEWGGETMFVHVSAKTGEGIDQLLDNVILQGEVLELKSYPARRATGVVIEALLDRGRGPVARVMIQDGTLRAGDVVLAGAAWGKVRAMTDEAGRAVTEAGPATPVEVLGLAEVPSAGDPVHAVKDAKTAEEIAETRRKKASKSLIPQDSRVSLEALTTRLSEADQLELKLIVKGDVQGSVEAVGQALTKLSTAKVKVTIVHAAVGAITEGDVNLAVASKAIITGFNVRPAGKSTALAESEGVEIRLYNIIYNAVDDIRAAMEGLLPATKVEKPLGKAEVRQVIRMSKAGLIAGCMVIQGLVKRTAEARLVRDNVVVWTGKLAGLRRFKDDAKEVPEGTECGIQLEGYQDIKEHDIIESFEIDEVKAKL
jgi:translation initiation factor IF-2